MNGGGQETRTAHGHGQPGRSGPLNNSNARKDGTWIIRRERKELLQRAIDGRSAEGRYVADQRGDLIASLGGAESVSVQKEWLATEAAHLRLELAYVRSWLATQSPINKRKRAAHPIVKDYCSLVAALRGVLSDIGLERQAKQVPDLDTYLRQYDDTAATDGPGEPPTNPAPPTVPDTSAPPAHAASEPVCGQEPTDVVSPDV